MDHGSLRPTAAFFNDNKAVGYGIDTSFVAAVHERPSIVIGNSSLAYPVAVGAADLDCVPVFWHETACLERGNGGWSGLVNLRGTWYIAGEPL